MRKALTNTPEFDSAAFLWRIRDWRPLLDGPGNNRVVVEWCVTSGPKCFVYPAARRSAGLDLCADVPGETSDERWADWLEFEFIPHVVRALEHDGFPVQVICADQRPIQTMRQRRRALEKFAHERTGHGH